MSLGTASIIATITIAAVLCAFMVLLVIGFTRAMHWLMSRLLDPPILEEDE